MKAELVVILGALAYISFLVGLVNLELRKIREILEGEFRERD